MMVRTPDLLPLFLNALFITLLVFGACFATQWFFAKQDADWRAAGLAPEQQWKQWGWGRRFLNGCKRWFY